MNCPADVHDTLTAYTSRGCRCPEARRLRARDEKLRRLRRSEGYSRRVPSVGTIRRIRALWAIGWPSAVIAERLGWTIEARVTNLARRGTDRQYVYATTARMVRALYDELSMTPGPSPQTRLRAIRAGYAPPLAWNDDEIDDPDAQPYTEGRLRRRSEDVAEEWEHLRQFGYSDTAIAAQLGIEAKSLERALKRASHAA